MANANNDKDLLLMSELSYVNMPESTKADSTKVDTNFSVHDLAQEGIRAYEEEWLGSMKLAGTYTDDPAKKTTAQITYEQRIAIYEQILADPKYANWTIEGSCNDNGAGGSGFVGYAINTGATPIIVSRGSEGKESFDDPHTMLNATDWTDNYRLSYLPDTAQQVAMLEFTEDMIAKYGYTALDFTGHSKGGNNAIYAYIAYLSEHPELAPLFNCQTFNAPGFSANFSDKYRDEIAQFGGNIIEHQNQFDLTSSLLNNIGTVEIYQTSWADKSTLALLNHGLWAFLDEEGNFMPAADKKALDCDVMHYLSNSFTENAPDWMLEAFVDFMIIGGREVSMESLGEFAEFMRTKGVYLPRDLLITLFGMLSAGTMEFSDFLDAKLTEYSDIAGNFLNEKWNEFILPAAEELNSLFESAMMSIFPPGKGFNNARVGVDGVGKALYITRAARQKAFRERLDELKAGLLAFLQSNATLLANSFSPRTGEDMPGIVSYGSSGGVVSKLKIVQADFDQAAADMQAAYDQIESDKKDLERIYGAMRANWRGLAGDAFEAQSRRLIKELEKNQAKLAKLISDIKQVKQVSAETDQQLAQAVAKG